ncbi:carbohydrate ABC transporter permease [Paenibacillus cymbidii]|uniref:carbohydrate ABC transporter permease n=1 Tax=Paenibacillus cymbidii TaxID=1639034 RepID=UPI001080A529|nr:carbohydrate ABC transporter permease [Paenibacillus cymbidii]
MVKRRIAAGGSDRAFDIVVHVLLALLLLVVLYPLLYIVSASFSDPYAVTNGQMLLWPVGFTWEGYDKIFASDDIWNGYKNAIVYTLVGTTVNVVLTIMAAYPLSRSNFMARNFFMFLFAFTMFFSGGLIPLYMVVKSLGLLNSMWALIIPSAVSIWNIIVARTYFQMSIPNELYEAAQIDGCRNFRYLLSVVLPLSKPIVAVLVLFYGVGHWNKFFDALIFLNDEDKYPLQLILRNILIKNMLSEQMLDQFTDFAEQDRIAEVIKYGLIVVSSVPMLVIYPFVQKYFIKGVMIGAIKG